MVAKRPLRAHLESFPSRCHIRLWIGCRFVLDRHDEHCKCRSDSGQRQVHYHNHLVVLYCCDYIRHWSGNGIAEGKPPMTLANQPMNTLDLASYASVALGILSVAFGIAASCRALHLYCRRRKDTVLQVKVTEADYLTRLVRLLVGARTDPQANVPALADKSAIISYEHSLDQVEQGLKDLAVYHRSIHPDLSFRIPANAGFPRSVDDS
jgi:hypothetical protein